jgi:cold shock CspA family protein
MDLHVTLRDMPHSDFVADYATRRASKLSELFARMTSCRVVVEAPHRHRRHGNAFRVRVQMAVPGHELVTQRAPDDQHHRDAFAAIDDAFDDAARVLRDYAGRARGDVKHHERRSEGIVTRLFLLRGYGFLETPEGDEVYFHSHSVLAPGFDRLKRGARVRFVEEAGEKGPQASTVVML